MKFTVILSLCAVICAPVIAADTTPVATGATNLVDKGSYALGANIGNNLRNQGAEPNIDQFVAGFRDALGNKSKLAEQELREAYIAWQQDVRSKKTEVNKKAGEVFLAKKSTEADVKKFADGLLYKVLTTGKGAQPKPEDRVSAHYRGTLIDGTEFDSSYSRGKPLVTGVRGVIPGWQEALTNMHVGDKWELYIPSALGYGERGGGAKIGPNATLVFEMELLGIEPPDTNAPPSAPTLNFPGSGSQPIRVAPGAGGGSQPIRVTPGGGNQPIKVQPAK